MLVNITLATVFDRTKGMAQARAAMAAEPSLKKDGEKFREELLA
jgi:hypothetical protein